MNKKIIFGTLISTVILLLLPSVSAVQSNKILRNDNKIIGNDLTEALEKLKDLKTSIKNGNIEKFDNEYEKIYTKESKGKINDILKELKNGLDNPKVQPQFTGILTFIKLILQTISLIVSLIYLPISIVLRIIFFVISFIISFPFRVVQFILNTLIKIIDNLIDLLSGNSIIDKNISNIKIIS